MQKLYLNHEGENTGSLKFKYNSMKCDTIDMKRKIQDSVSADIPIKGTVFINSGHLHGVKNVRGNSCGVSGGGGDLPGIMHNERTSPPFNSDVTMTSTSASPELINSKRESVSRKCTARKNLMENLFTRQSPVKRSYTFVAGERQIHDGYFPHLSSFMDDSGKVQDSKNKKTKLKKSVSFSHGRRARSEKDRKSAEKIQKLKERQEMKKISLPEILRDISLSAKQQSRMERRTPDNRDNDTGPDNGDILEYIDKELDKEKLKAAKYRPITPGLIQELSRMRLTSKQKASQWVKAIPTDKKYFYGDNYLLGHPELMEHHPDWIYSND